MKSTPTFPFNLITNKSGLKTETTCTRGKKIVLMIDESADVSCMKHLYVVNAGKMR